MIVLAYSVESGTVCFCVLDTTADGMLKTASDNVVTSVFTKAQRTLNDRAIRVRELFSQSNWAGLIAYYQSEEGRHQAIISERRSSRPVQRTQGLRLISSPVDNRYITLPNVMDTIEECFSKAIERTQQGKFAIYGMGGAGKTSLAAHYAKTRFDLKGDVLWLRGKTEDTLNSSFAAAAIYLNLEKLDTATTSLAKRRDAVKNYLSHLAGKMAI